MELALQRHLTHFQRRSNFHTTTTAAAAAAAAAADFAADPAAVVSAAGFAGVVFDVADADAELLVLTPSCQRTLVI